MKPRPKEGPIGKRAGLLTTVIDIGPKRVKTKVP